MPLSNHLSCRIQHILYKNSVAHGWVIDEDMGHRADEFAVLDDRGAGHECVKVDTTRFLSDFLPIITSKCLLGLKNEQVLTHKSSFG